MNCYFVVDDPNNLWLSEQFIIDRLEAVGYTVTLRDNSAAAPNSTDLVAISGKPESSTIGSTYRDYPGPVILFERFLIDNMKMGPYQTVWSGEPTDIELIGAGHPLQAGFPDGITTVGSADLQTALHEVDVLGPDAITIGKDAADSDGYNIFAYEQGGEGDDGFIMPARRVSSFTIGDQPGTPAFNSTGIALIEAAIAWAGSVASVELMATMSSASAVSGEFDDNLLIGRVQSASAARASLSGGVAVPDPLAPAATPTSYAERVALIEADRVDVSVRVEVLDDTDAVLGEIDVDDVVIRYDTLAAIHRSVEFTTTDELEWSWQRIRPFVTVETREYIEELPLGVFVLTDPRPDTDTPPTYEVTGYDKLYLLDQKLTAPVSLPAGQPILFAVRELLAQNGFNADRIDDSRGSEVLSEARVWGIEFEGTWLTVINDLLGMVAYEQLHIDAYGIPESGPKIAADQRPIAWRYDAQSSTGITLVEGRELNTDYTNAPNQWQFWRADVDRDDPPVIGDGLYVVNNVNEGPSSQTARRGLIVRSDNDGPIEASSQSDLEANGDAIVAQEIQSVVSYQWRTDINPYHEHLDVVECIDRNLGVAGPFVHISWEMNVLGREMGHVGHKVTGGIVNAG